jgi:NitT/TauT family transport system ATP-binding protein
MVGVVDNSHMVGSKPLIRMEGLSKRFLSLQGDGVMALKNVTASISEGEFVTVVGPSGCGKSTLMKILAGLVSYSDGIVTMADDVVRGSRRDIGVVFQSSILLPWRTVLDNVLLPAEVLGLPTQSSLSRARELIELVGIGGFEQKYPQELSGGMQQRASIARALLHDPSILLMDEPFGALDALTRENMNLELQRIWRESRKTIVLITHSVPEAVFLADRIFVMTPRPGRLEKIVSVDLPRPRDLSVMNSHRFGEIASEIRMLLNQKSMLD